MTPTSQCGTGPGAPTGDGACAGTDATSQLEHTLSKLAWTVLYGKAHDAQSLAISAEQFLLRLKSAQAQSRPT